jgi:kynurenine 3-monooxygenase
LGDAAHAMVPFYGQGLNCGFEDVRVLDTLLRSSGILGSILKPEGDRELEEVLKAYSSTRKEDLHAICDMAMDN